MRTSFFELFKIGIGPSSSHTMAPLRAAREFAELLRDEGLLDRLAALEIHLYGSLALTGKGHGTDRALQMGLLGLFAETLDPAEAAAALAAIADSGQLCLLGEREIAFDAARQILFHQQETLAGGANGMRFRAYDYGGKLLKEQVVYSTGGGFLRREGEAPGEPERRAPVPYPFQDAVHLLEQCEQHHLEIWQLALANEAAWRPEAEILTYVDSVWQTMRECIERGQQAEGILPGGLKVRRRARGLLRAALGEDPREPLSPLDRVDAAAMAVAEENAAGGRVVTAPTNGAAGIVPAAGDYLERIVPGHEALRRYLLTAGIIGILYKENASISGAEVGCQGEIGVACSMAAGGLAAALGGNNRQVEHAAEIAMEHNLGTTCDPIAGLVQIPCIERNAMGAVQAIHACRIALREGNEHKVSLDQIIETMYRTGLDMQSRYKETSQAGLALNVIQC
jgi:L-serine dehydratase